MGKANCSRRRPYIVSLVVDKRLDGRSRRAILSMQSPRAMSVVVARRGWLVRDVECRRRVWPPEIRRVRKGKVGWGVVSVGREVSAETSRGVRAWACMWLTPSSGICQAVERPLAVSRPVARLERMPGPRVTETKSGLSLWIGVWLGGVRVSVRPGFEGLSPLLLGALGRALIALSIRRARFSWCDSKDLIGWTPP